jgi:alpha-beta hydrolase superfamily lysophospholipase
MLLLLSFLSACSPRLAPAGPEATDPFVVWNDPERRAAGRIDRAKPAVTPVDPTDEWLSARALAAIQAHPPARGAFTADDGLVLPLWAWLPDRPRGVILAVHGFTDYANAFAAVAPLWADAGYAVYAFDQRGFGAAPNRGLWAGTQRMIQDLRNLARVVRGGHPDLPLFLLGESMGGAVVLVEQARPGALRADGVILSAPAVWSRDTQPWYQRAGLWLAVRLAPGLAPDSSGVKIRISDNDAMLRALSRDPLVQKSSRIDRLAGLVDLMDAARLSAARQRAPLLLLYGQKDQVIPARPSQLFWAALPAGGKARLALYPQGWHLLLRDLQAERVADDILAWLGDPGASLPSGAEAQAVIPELED